MIYKNVSMSSNIFELINWVHVPEVDKIFSEVIEEIKSGELKHCLDEFEGKLKKYYDTLFVNSEKQEYETFHWYELTRYREWDWRMTVLRPYPPPDTPPYEVMPRDIIAKITESLVNPEKTISLQGTCSQSLNKTVDLKFVRVSDNFLCGTVGLLEKDNLSGKSKYTKGGITLDGDIDTAYRVFSHYTHKYPQIREQFIREFNETMLPQLIDMDACTGGKKIKSKIVCKKRRKGR